jgi:hypothetical protein
MHQRSKFKTDSDSLANDQGNVMGSLDPDLLKKGLYANWALLAIFLIMCSFKSPYWWLVVLGLLGLLLRTMYIIYLNESYTAFLIHCVAGLIAAFLAMIVICFYLGARSDYGMTFVDAISIAMCPVLFIATQFAFIYFTRSKKGAFFYEVSDNRVLIGHKYVDPLAANILFGIIGGLTWVLWNWSDISQGFLLGGLMMTAIIYMLYAGRHSIRMLRRLLAREKRTPRLTFEHIEVLREARGRWWLGRLLSWLMSLRSKA